jgi:hypothetical protein
LDSYIRKTHRYFERKEKKEEQKNILLPFSGNIEEMGPILEYDGVYDYFSDDDATEDYQPTIRDHYGSLRRFGN